MKFHTIKTKLKQLIRNVYIDFSIQRRFLGGTIRSQFVELGVKDTTNTPYEEVEYVFFNFLKINDDDVFADIGCGKGRVINYLLWKGVKNPIYGFEYHADVANQVKKSLRRFKNVQILEGDVFNHFPMDATLFFLFNPFEKEMMTKFIDMVKISPNRSKIRIVYSRGNCNQMFLDDPEFNSESVKLPWSTNIRDFYLITINPPSID